MSFNINEFQSRLQFGGARPSLFEVILTNPVTAAGLENFQFMCRAAQLPAASQEPVATQYFGREIKFAGNRQYADWTVTVLNDEDFAIRDNLERWVDVLNGPQSNQREPGYSSASSYKGSADVMQYSKDNRVIRQYKILGMIPTEVSMIQLDWSTNEIETFDVTFTVDYWEVARNTTNPLDGAFSNLGL